LLDRDGEGWQMFLDDVPRRHDVGALIFVPEQISDRTDLAPWNV
jgi:hypothetical protein